MSMFNKKVSISLLLALALVVGLITGCSGNNPKKEDVGGKGEEVSNEIKPITFSFFSSDPNPNWNNMKDEVGAELTKRTGVTLDAEFAVGDPA